MKIYNFYYGIFFHSRRKETREGGHLPPPHFPVLDLDMVLMVILVILVILVIPARHLWMREKKGGGHIFFLKGFVGFCNCYHYLFSNRIPPNSPPPLVFLLHTAFPRRNGKGGGFLLFHSLTYRRPVLDLDMVLTCFLALTGGRRRGSAVYVMPLCFFWFSPFIWFILIGRRIVVCIFFPPSSMQGREEPLGICFPPRIFKGRGPLQSERVGEMPPPPI